MAKKDINNIPVKPGEDPLDVFYQRNEKADAMLCVAAHRLPGGKIDFDILNLGLKEDELFFLTLRIKDRLAKGLMV